MVMAILEGQCQDLQHREAQTLQRARLHVLERAQRWKEAYHYAIFHGQVTPPSTLNPEPQKEGPALEWDLLLGHLRRTSGGLADGPMPLGHPPHALMIPRPPSTPPHHQATSRAVG